MRKNLCSLMFTDVYVHPNGQMGNCCKSKPATVTESEIRQLGPRVWNFNSEFMRRKSEMVKQDLMPDSCETCIKNPGNNFFTMRNAWGDREQAQSDDEIISGDHINCIELYLDTSCDLACAYCGPNLSSTWAKQLGVSIEKRPDSHTRALLDSLNSYLEGCDWTRLEHQRLTIRFLGGEPTYIPLTLTTIRDIIARVPHRHLRIEIISNINTKPKIMSEYIELFNSAPDVYWQISASIDDVADRCEAVRYGLVWDRMLNNLTALFDCAHLHLVIAPTINIFNLPYLGDFYRYINHIANGHRCREVVMGMTPVYDVLSISRLPKSMTNYLLDAASVPMYPATQHQLLHLKDLIGTKMDDESMRATLSRLRLVMSRPGYDYRNLFPHLDHLFEQMDQGRP